MSVPDHPDPKRDAEFDAFYRAEAARLMRFLLRLGSSPADAADAAGHAFTEVYVRWEHLRSPSEYLRTTASRELARLATRPRTDTDRALRGGWALEVMEDVYQQAEVRTVLEALRKLPERQREVMSWHYDGYTTAEIAAVTGLSAATIRSHLRFARENLRRLGVGGERSEVAR